MRILSNLSFGAFCLILGLAPVCANERYFAYSYEPETMPRGGLEYEQWLTLRAGRNAAVGQKNFNRWEFREELEYGVTDNYTVSLYLHENLENFRDPLLDRDTTHFR